MDEERLKILHMRPGRAEAHRLCGRTARRREERRQESGPDGEGFCLGKIFRFLESLDRVLGHGAEISRYRARCKVMIPREQGLQGGDGDAPIPKFERDTAGRHGGRRTLREHEARGGKGKQEDARHGTKNENVL